MSFSQMNKFEASVAKPNVGFPMRPARQGWTAVVLSVITIVIVILLFRIPRLDDFMRSAEGNVLVVDRPIRKVLISVDPGHSLVEFRLRNVTSLPVTIHDVQPCCGDLVKTKLPLTIGPHADSGISIQIRKNQGVGQKSLRSMQVYVDVPSPPIRMQLELLPDQD